MELARVTGTILALDLGVRMGFCIGVTVPTSGSKILRAPHEGSEVGLAALLNWLNHHLGEDRPALVVKEKRLSFVGFKRKNTSAGTMESQIELHGVVKAMCGRLLIPFKDVSRPTVMKHFVGRGDFKRKDGKLAAIERCKQLGYVEKACTDNDRCDAVALWDWAIHTHGTPTKARRQLAMFEGASA